MTRTINFKGEEIGISFGMSTVMDYCKAKKIKMSQVQQAFQDLDFEDTFLLLSFAIKHGSRKLGKKIEVKPLDLADYIDDHPDFFTEALEGFQDSLPKASDDDSTDLVEEEADVVIETEKK